MSSPSRSESSALPSDGILRQTQRTLLVGTIMALGSAALYGGNIPAARMASQAGFPGADLIVWRALILVPLLLAIALALKTRLMPPRGERAMVLRLVLAASFTAAFYLSALDHLSVPMAVVIFYTFPLIVMVLSNRIEGRRLSLVQIGVFCAAFMGLLLAVGPSFAGLSLRGMVYALAGSLSCACMFIFAGRVENAPLRTVFWTQVMMAPVAFGFTLLKGGIVPLSTFHVAPIAISISVSAYVLGYGLQLMAAARISPSRASLLFLFEPLAAIIAAWFVLAETLTPIQLAGLALILSALAAEIWSGARTKQDQVSLP